MTLEEEGNIHELNDERMISPKYRCTSFRTVYLLPISFGLSTQPPSKVEFTAEEGLPTILYVQM